MEPRYCELNEAQNHTPKTDPMNDLWLSVLKPYRSRKTLGSLSAMFAVIHFWCPNIMGELDEHSTTMIHYPSEKYQPTIPKYWGRQNMFKATTMISQLSTSQRPESAMIHCHHRPFCCTSARLSVGPAVSARLLATPGVSLGSNNG